MLIPLHHYWTENSSTAIWGILAIDVIPIEGKVHDITKAPIEETTEEVNAVTIYFQLGGGQYATKVKKQIATFNSITDHFNGIGT